MLFAFCVCGLHFCYFFPAWRVEWFWVAVWWTMQGLRLVFSTVITIGSREARDACVLLSLLVLIRQDTQLIPDTACTYRVYSCTLCTEQLSFGRGRNLPLLWLKHCAVFTWILSPVVSELIHWSVDWSFHTVSVRVFFIGGSRLTKCV